MRKSTLFKMALFIGSFVVIKNFCIHETSKFSINEIASKRPFNSAWDLKPLSPPEKKEVLQALSQSFSYLSYGGQCFVFQSADQKYVIKFFKQSLYELPLWLKFTPHPWPIQRYYEKKRLHRIDKLQRDFESYKISFEELKEESALLFVHLNKSFDLHKEITITDRLGISHPHGI